MKHESRVHGWLKEYNSGQVGYMAVVYLIMFIDATVDEEECGNTRTYEYNIVMMEVCLQRFAARRIHTKYIFCGSDR